MLALALGGLAALFATAGRPEGADGRHAPAAPPLRAAVPAGARVGDAPLRARRIALTFDDGPNGRITRRVLDLLARHGARATFFVVGAAVEREPELVRRIQREGHEIGVHTQFHRRLTSATAEQAWAEIVYELQLLARLTGRRPRLFRPPYGAEPREIRRLCARLGLREVTWSASGHDWESGDPERIVGEILGQLRPGAIVLLHDGDEGRPDADRGVVVAVLERLLPRLQSLGYRSVSVSRLLRLSGKHRAAAAHAAPLRDAIPAAGARRSARRRP